MTEYQNIKNHLVIQVSAMNKKGLFHGRIGVILALYCYGKCHNNESLCEISKEILQMSSEDNFYGDCSLESGLAGIGLGYVLLSQAGMFNDPLSELLYDVDQKIMSFDPRRLDDYSFRTGALGVLYYINKRMSVDKHCSSLDKQYMVELKNTILQNNITDIPNDDAFLQSLARPEWSIREYEGKDIGIDNGVSYFILKDTYEKIFLCN